MTDRKILRLTAENFMRLKAVSISPSGDVVYITGANGEGKSSILNAICAALNWRDVSGNISEPIHKGKTKATVSLDLGDMTVTRTWTPSGSQLKVESKDGAVYKSPQAMLDKFFSSIGFDPLEFIRMQPKDQRQTLMDLLGIDFSELENEKSKLLQDKLSASNQVKSLDMQLDTLSKFPEDTPDKEISASDIIEEISRCQAIIQSFHDLERKKNESLVACNNSLSRISELEKELEYERQRACEFEAEVNDISVQMRKIVLPDVDPLKEKLLQVERINQNVRVKHQLNKIINQLRDAEEIVSNCNQAIKDIDQDKHDALKSAKFPVAGLSFDESGVLFNNVPLKQASSAEQIRVSLAIGIAMNPSMKVMLIRDGSLMDSKTRELVADMASEHGMQVWIEAVDESGHVGFVVEDGELKPVPPGQQGLA